MSSQLNPPGPFGAPLSPSPLEYPFRQFLPLADYSEESIRSGLSAAEKRGGCAYRTKKLQRRPREVIVVYSDKELEEVC